MDKFIAQSKTATIPHLYHIAFSNHDPGSSTITSDNLSGWQGFDIDNNYLYVYEGYDAAGVAKTATGDNFGAFVSVYSIEGKQMVYRSNIRYPSKALASPSLRYFEPEGIKAIDNKLCINDQKIIFVNLFAINLVSDFDRERN